MKLFEEFKIWEDLWDGEYPDTSEILYTSPSGKIINLADPEEFAAELKAEEARYREYVREVKTNKYKTNHNQYNYRVQCLVDSGKTPEEADREVEDLWVKSHMDIYTRELTDALNAGLVKQSNIDAIKADYVGKPFTEKHFSKVFDLTDERSLISYIDYYFLQYKHPRAKPDVWINSLHKNRSYIVRGLASRGLYDLAKKANDRMNKHINKRLSELESKN